jgi:hypothetical protein
MSSVRFSVRLDTSHHGSPRPVRDAGVVADSLTDIHNAMGEVRLRCQQEPHTQGFIDVTTRKKSEDLSPASMEAMQ